MADKIFADLKKNRGYLRQKVTRRSTIISNEFQNFSSLDCAEHLDSLKVLSEKLFSVDDQIGNLILEFEGQDALNIELMECETYEISINRAIRMLKEQSSNLTARLDSAASLERSESDTRDIVKLRLPELPLPKFGNEENENITQFFKNFEEIINKYSLSGFEKFVYMERQLSGQPLTLVKSLTGSQRCYADAKDLLNQAFARPVKQKFNIIKQLTNLHFNSINPYKFISDVRLIVSAFEDLEIDIKSIIQYFVWSSLPTNYQNQLLHISNSTYPTLEDIQKFIFDAVDRVNSKYGLSNEPESSNPVSFAANVHFEKDSSKNYKFKPCVLCDSTEADHPIFKCSKYPDAKSKVERLKYLKLCTKCAGVKHESKDCKYKFNKPCFNCKKMNHFSFLCLKHTSAVSNCTIN